ncbi:MAG: zf-HC2 domain-containing protein, partial [Myxococcota bacterium]|nr:zf-HC2 domain-containing protein [Myxococcota bacterium]
MSCEFEEDLTASLDRELSVDRERLLQRHLTGCASCTATLALLRDTLPALVALPALESSAAQRGAVLTR